MQLLELDERVKLLPDKDVPEPDMKLVGRVGTVVDTVGDWAQAQLGEDSYVWWPMRAMEKQPDEVEMANGFTWKRVRSKFGR